MTHFSEPRFKRILYICLAFFLNAIYVSEYIISFIHLLYKTKVCVSVCVREEVGSGLAGRQGAGWLVVLQECGRSPHNEPQDEDDNADDTMEPPRAARPRSCGPTITPNLSMFAITYPTPNIYSNIL